MIDDLEDRVRTTLQRQAASVSAEDLPVRRPEDEPAPIAIGRGTEPSGRSRPLVLVAAATVIVGGLVGVTLTRPEPPVVPVDAGAPETPASAGSASDPTGRAWPLTDDEPLADPPPDDRLATPEAAARDYLQGVAALPPDWPLDDVVVEEARATVLYRLQDAAAEVRLARTDNGRWYVTSAATDLVRPAIVGPTSVGLDVSLSPGPRTYESGVHVRLTALAADGRVLGTAAGRTSRPPTGDAAAAAPVVSVRWAGSELAAVVRADVLDDHDGDGATPEAVIGHWTSALAVPAPTGVPEGFDIEGADVVFTSAGNADDVAGAYLRDRFPDHPAPGIKVERARTRARRAFVGWTVEGGLPPGTLFLRRGDEGWSVVAAVTRGVDLSGLRLEGGRIVGAVTSTDGNSLFADVLRPDGTPVPEAPRPSGQPDAAYRFGTAAGPANRRLVLDVTVGDERPVVRVNHVGGTILTISEIRMPLPAA